MGKQEGKEERKVAAQFGKVPEVRAAGIGVSSSTGSAEERGAREEGDDMRAPAVSRVESGETVRWAGCRKQKVPGRERREKGSFQKG